MRESLPTCATWDEAVALAVQALEPGDRLVLHKTTCPFDGEDAAIECTCTPQLWQPLGHA